jgi:hypothetical protein
MKKTQEKVCKRVKKKGLLLYARMDEAAVEKWLTQYRKSLIKAGIKLIAVFAESASQNGVQLNNAKVIATMQTWFTLLMDIYRQHGRLAGPNLTAAGIDVAKRNRAKNTAIWTTFIERLQKAVHMDVFDIIMPANVAPKETVVQDDEQMWRARYATRKAVLNGAEAKLAVATEAAIELASEENIARAQRMTTLVKQYRESFAEAERELRRYEPPAVDVDTPLPAKKRAVKEDEQQQQQQQHVTKEMIDALMLQRAFYIAELDMIESRYDTSQSLENAASVDVIYDWEDALKKLKRVEQEIVQIGGGGGDFIPYRHDPVWTQSVLLKRLHYAQKQLAKDEAEFAKMMRDGAGASVMEYDAFEKAVQRSRQRVADVNKALDEFSARRAAAAPRVIVPAVEPPAKKQAVIDVDDRKEAKYALQQKRVAANRRLHDAEYDLASIKEKGGKESSPTEMRAILTIWGWKLNNDVPDANVLDSYKKDYARRLRIALKVVEESKKQLSEAEAALEEFMHDNPSSEAEDDPRIPRPAPASSPPRKREAEPRVVFDLPSQTVVETDAIRHEQNIIIKRLTQLGHSVGTNNLDASRVVAQLASRYDVLDQRMKK